MSKKEGLVSLQKKLLKEIGSSSAAESINDVDYGRKRIGEILGCRRKRRGEIPSNKKEDEKADEKVFIVLDDVDGEEQVQNLIGQVRLDPNTRIIITTRNTGVYKIIEQRMAREMKEDAPQILDHEMKVMEFYPALQLFKRRAFREDSRAKDLDSLSIDIVNTTGCLPLALKVIGSLLFGKPKTKWENTLKQLMNVPHEDVQKTLMISYKDLNYRQREIFLDIACFFINEDITNANYMWEACGFYPNLEIDVLIEMSLINRKDNKFWMHDQLRDLGQEMVRQESPTILGRRSRLWTREEVLDLVGTKLRKENVEAIDLRGQNSHISIKSEEIERFENLRFLRLSNGTLQGDFTDCLPMLKWISWSSPQLDWSVSNMHLKNLVVLEFFDNHFVDDLKMQDLIERATKLKSLALVGCRCITRTPDLSGCLTLERFTVDYCKMLKDIDSSIAKLKCLLELNIICCDLEHVPDEIGGLVKLERFSLESCRNVRILPTSIGNLTSLRELDLSSTSITSLPDSIRTLQCLSYLSLEYSSITEIPDEIGELVKLERFSLKSCPNVRILPTSIGHLTSLRELDLTLMSITSLPDSIGTLQCLSYLNLQYSKITKIPDEIGGLVKAQHLCLADIYIEQLPASIGNLKSLHMLNLSRSGHTKSPYQWELPKTIGELKELEVLYLGRRNELVGKIPDEIGCLSSLEVLDLCWTGISSVPETINQLPHLSTLDLRWCHKIIKLPELPVSLVYLYIKSHSLEVVPNLSKLTNLVELDLSDGSDDPDGSDGSDDPDDPDGQASSNLEHKCDLGWIGRLSKLKKLELCLLDIATPPTELGSLSLLEDLSLYNLDLQPLKQLPSSLLSLVLDNSSSTGLPLFNSSSQVQEIQRDGFSQLQRLDLRRCDLLNSSIPSSITTLKVDHCPNLIQCLSTLASLEELSICDCDSIKRIRLCGEGGSLGFLDQSESSSNESTHCSSGALLLPNAFKKLEALELTSCENLLEIEVTGTLSSLQSISIQSCNAMEKLTGIRNLKKLHRLEIWSCPTLWDVGGLDELEFLMVFWLVDCRSLEALFDISISKIPDECGILIQGCGGSLNSSPAQTEISFKEYKKLMAQRGEPQPETNKEKAKMEGDAVELDTELLLHQIHPSTSSQDHEISEEPPIDNVNKRRRRE